MIPKTWQAILRMDGVQQWSVTRDLAKGPVVLEVCVEDEVIILKWYTKQHEDVVEIYVEEFMRIEAEIKQTDRDLKELLE